MTKLLPSIKRILLAVGAVYAIALIGCASLQRKLLYYPTHHRSDTSLAPWEKDGLFLGHARLTKRPAAVWLMVHGNGGQASDRDITLPCFPAGDCVYFLEYPGYGSRPGSPSQSSLNAAAQEGYEELRRLYPKTPICVLGESIGSGPASFLCTLPRPPDKLVLVVPFDKLTDVAAEAMPFLPARLLLFDRWDNVEALRPYSGPVEIYGARDDEVIPVKHATRLAQALPRAQFVLISGGHNEWSHGDKVRLRGP